MPVIFPAQRGIAFVVGSSLCLFSCLFLVISGVQFYAFHKATGIVEQATEKQFPTFMLTADLVRECEWLRGMSFRLSQSENGFVLQRNTDALSLSIHKLQRAIKKIEELHLHPRLLHLLKEQVADFEAISIVWEKQVAHFMAIRNKRANLLKYLRVLSNDLTQCSDSDSLYIQKWDHHMHMTIFYLSLLCSDINESYGMKVSQEIYGELQSARQLMEKIPDVRQEQVDRIYNQLVEYALGESGILLQFRKFHAATIAFSAQELRVNALVDAILFNAEQLLAQTQEDATRSRNTLQNWKAPFFFSLLFLTFIAFCIIAGVYVYLSKCVVKPVIQLNECMHLRTQNVKIPLPCDGTGEVQEMSRSVAYFISRLEEREEELQRSHDNLEQQVRERTSELEHLSRRLILAQEEERFRLAAELHDDVGATMSVIKFGIERAVIMLQQHEKEQAQIPLNEAVELVKGLARQLRRIQNELRPAYIDLGLVNSIKMFCQDYQSAHPDLLLDIEAKTDETLPGTLRIVIFRIIQESLNNIAKHSKATRVSLSIINTGEEVVVSVRDNGCGFEYSAPEAQRGLGLKTMRERVELSGGNFTLETKRGKGTLITAYWNQHAAVWMDCLTRNHSGPDLL